MSKSGDKRSVNLSCDVAFYDRVKEYAWSKKISVARLVRVVLEKEMNSAGNI
jgi:hypothetical protein